MNQQNDTNKTVLIVALSVLGALLIGILIFMVLYVSGAIQVGQNSSAQPPAYETTATSGEPVATPEPTPAPTAPTQNAMTMYISNVNYSVYFRTAPVEDPGNIICEILRGTAITFLENAPGNIFAKISYNGGEGYVKREYLSSTPPAPVATAPPASSGDTSVKYTVYVVNVKNSIYLRSAPVENSSNIITTIPVGTAVGFIENTNGTFWKIKYNGQVGYSKSEYLSEYTTRGSVNGANNGGTTMTVCNVKHSIYLRSAPKENPSNIICEIPVGSTVRLIERTNGTFYKISWNGHTGYSKAEYLR